MEKRVELCIVWLLDADVDDNPHKPKKSTRERAMVAARCILDFDSKAIKLSKRWPVPPRTGPQYGMWLKPHDGAVFLVLEDVVEAIKADCKKKLAEL